MEERKLNDQIIGLQSAILIAVAAAGYIATDSIIKSFNAIKDPNSYTAIRTDNGIITDKIEIDLTYAESIVNNFKFICIISIAIAGIITTANILRIIKRKNNNA